MGIECIICKREIEEHDRIIAFDEVVFSDAEWEDLDEYDESEFGEVEPLSGGWHLAHYRCMFKED